MPWWIWLVLAGFWLAMLIIGVVYVIKKAMNTMHVASHYTGKINAIMDVLQEGPEEHPKPQPAIFTQPLSVAADKYADAHAEVIERKERRKERYMQRWDKWEQFNK